MGLTFYTVGHSTRSLSEFLELLRAYGISLVADVRAFPSSRRFPHFARETLASALERKGLGYVWLGKELGGYRKTGLGPCSPNSAWKSQGFRNYADHMLTEEFQAGVEKLVAQGSQRLTAILCAERFWWRCHRRLLADWLVAHGHTVIHILDLGRVVPHELSSTARIKDGHVIYPGGGPWSPGCARAFFKNGFRAGNLGA